MRISAVVAHFAEFIAAVENAEEVFDVDVVDVEVHMVQKSGLPSLISFCPGYCCMFG